MISLGCSDRMVALADRWVRCHFDSRASTAGIDPHERGVLMGNWKTYPALRQPVKGRKKPVRCIDTGVVYSSSTDAADILSEAGVLVCPRLILYVCQGKQKSTGGLRWEYA